VARLGLREVAVDPVQPPSLVERLGLTAPVADIAVNAKGLVQGLCCGRVLARQPPYATEEEEGVGRAEPVARSREMARACSRASAAAR
jgi:hypothetical protein